MPSAKTHPEFLSLLMNPHWHVSASGTLASLLTPGGVGREQHGKRHEAGSQQWTDRVGPRVSARLQKRVQERVRECLGVNMLCPCLCVKRRIVCQGLCGLHDTEPVPLRSAFFVLLTGTVGQWKKSQGRKEGSAVSLSVVL